MRKCIRCGTEMKENCAIKVQGAGYGIVLFFHNNAEGMAETIISGATSYGILEKLATGLYSCVLNRTIVCDYYNQEIHGDPTQPAGQGTSARLDGVYAYVDYGSGPVVKTEGYTVRDWGNGAEWIIS